MHFVKQSSLKQIHYSYDIGSGQHINANEMPLKPIVFRKGACDVQYFKAAVLNAELVMYGAIFVYYLIKTFQFK